MDMCSEKLYFHQGYMMATKPECKPCTCGHKALIDDQKGLYYVVCPVDLIRPHKITCGYPTRAQAIDAWNEDIGTEPIKYNGPHSALLNEFWQIYYAKSPNAAEIACGAEAIYIGRSINIMLKNLKLGIGLLFDE